MTARRDRILAGVLALWAGGMAALWRAEEGLAAGKGPASARHVIVYSEPGKFCGFPANGGAWSWGNEILVRFELAGYDEKDHGHSIDKHQPSEAVQARSLDGGQTWTLERPQGLRLEGEPKEFEGRIDFAHPDFALRCGGPAFQFSYDRGKTWSEFYALPKVGERRLLSRTDYIVNSADDCLMFLAAAKTNGKEGQPFCAQTRDGGKTIGFVSWMTPEPEGFSIMPSTVRTARNQLVSAIRRKEKGSGFIEVYVSKDDGRTWRLLSTPAQTGKNNGNPPSMVRLKDGRIVLTYGYRSEPMGIRAKVSSDGGRTWGEEIHLRDDGRTWDLGYPRTVVTPDGRLVTIYYFTTTEHKEEHIAATLWTP